MFYIYWTALHRAALWNHVNIVRILGERNANLNAIDEGNWTPLHVAVKWNRMAVVEILLGLGANVCIKDESGVCFLFIDFHFVSPSFTSSRR